MCVGALCCPRPLQPLGDGCNLDFVPYAPGPHSRQFVRVATPDIVGVPTVTTTHHGCVHNELRAILTRVTGVVPVPTEAGLAACRVAMRRLLPHLPFIPSQGLYDILEGYHGPKRVAYERACDSVAAHGCTRNHSSITMFVKAAKTAVVEPPERGADPDPRAIQFRDRRFNVAIGRWLKPIEHWWYRLRGKRLGRTNHVGPIFGKCYNAFQRARYIRSKFAAFRECVCISLDASRFDEHQHILIMRLVEHGVYHHHNNHPEFARLLSYQLRNKCYSGCGIRYTTTGRRMSGDMNTALGNCILTFVMAQAWLDPLEIHYDLFIDGDDCLLFIEADDFELVHTTCQPTYLSMGQVMKVENVARRLEDVNWCQSKPVELPTGWAMVRYPHKVLSSLCGTKFVNVSTQRAAFVYSLGLCNLAIYRGCPVLQEFALALCRNAHTKKTLKHYEVLDIYQRSALPALLEGDLQAMAELKPIEPSHAARLSYSRAWSVSPDEQVEQEATLRAWSFPLHGDVHLPSDRSEHWESVYSASPEVDSP